MSKADVQWRAEASRPPEAPLASRREFG